MGREIYRKYHNVINYFVGLAAILCAMIGMGILYNLASGKGHTIEKTMLNNSWIVEFDNKVYSDVVLDEFSLDRMINRGEKVVLKGYLPGEWNYHSPTIITGTRNCAISVYINGNLKYSYGEDILERRGLLGSGIHFIPLDNNDKGGTIRIELTSGDFSGFSSIGDVALTEYRDSFSEFIDDNLLFLVIGSFFILLGLFLVFIGGIFILMKLDVHGLLYLGILALCVGGWTTSYHRLAVIYGGSMSESTRMEYLCLMAGCVALLMFFRDSVMSMKNNSALKISYRILMWTEILSYSVILILDLTSAIHMTSFLLFIQLCMCVEAVYILSLMIVLIRHGRKDGKIILIAFSIFVACVGIDVLSYAASIYWGINAYSDGRIASLGTVILVAFLICHFTLSIFTKYKDDHEKEVLYKLAYSDELTKVYNRRYCERIMDELTEKQQHYTIFSFDLNNLKKINDNMGHQYGDALISGFANILKETFTEDAVVGRMGGDEFIVLLDDKDIHSHDHSKEIKKYYEILERYNRQEENFQFSASYGYADMEEIKPVDGVVDSRKVYALADNRMYEMKSQNKDARH